MFWNRQVNTDVAPPAGVRRQSPPEMAAASRAAHVARSGTTTAATSWDAAPSGGRAGRVALQVPIAVSAERRRSKIVGDVRYVPPPSPWPYLAVAALIAVALVLAGRTRAWPRVLLGTLVVLVGAAAVETRGRVEREHVVVRVEDRRARLRLRGARARHRGDRRARRAAVRGRTTRRRSRCSPASRSCWRPG